MTDTLPKIGIYWLGANNSAFAKLCALSEGEEGVPGLIDSAFTHVDVWAAVRGPHAMPAHLEYDDYPRGRVMYQRTTGKHLVYGDGKFLGVNSAGKLLDSGSEVRASLMRMFGIDPAAVIWRHDAHYTFGRQRIDRLLDDDPD